MNATTIVDTTIAALLLASIALYSSLLIDRLAQRWNSLRPAQRPIAADQPPIELPSTSAAPAPTPPAAIAPKWADAIVPFCRPLPRLDRLSDCKLISRAKGAGFAAAKKWARTRKLRSGERQRAIEFLTATT
jgi:hypothetical protein